MKHTQKNRLALIGLGAVLLLSALLLVACGGEKAPPAERNAVTSVTLSGSTITVKASLTPQFLDQHKKEDIHLFELPSHYCTGDSLSDYTPVATTAAAGEMTFSLSDRDGLHARLYSSFLIATGSGDRGYTPLSAPVSLSNPGAAAEALPAIPVANTSIKGLISDDPAAALQMDVAHTVVDVYMDRLLLGAWQENAYAYTAHGVTAYLDGDELAALDETVASYTDAHVQVFLRLRLGDGIALTDGMYVPNSEANRQGYAVNMTDARTARLMEGFLSFLADRYATPERDTRPIGGFIMGYRVNDAAEYANAGSMTLADYITNYEKLVHVAHIALKSHNADARVYISLDDCHAADGRVGGWDVPTFLFHFRNEAELRGNYDWHIAAELYAADNKVWVEDPETDRTHYTVRNLGTLTDLIAGETYLAPEGQTRRLLISGMSIPYAAKGELIPTDPQGDYQAISYVYTYMTAMLNGRVEALIYDRHTDRVLTALEGPLTGLMPSPLVTELVGANRTIVPLFAAAGTNSASTADRLMTDLIGAPYSKLSAALAGSVPAVNRVTGTTSSSNYSPTHKGASTLITFADGVMEGKLANAGNLTFGELVRTDVLDTVTYHARFDRPYSGERMALTFDIPGERLQNGDALLFDLWAGPTGQVSSNSRLTLRLTRPAKGTDASGAVGDGAVVYESTLYSVSNSAWQTATFNIESFTALIGAEDTVTATLYVEGDDRLSYDLALAGVHATGVSAEEKNDSPVSIPIVIAVVAVLVVAVAGGAFLLYRFKFKKP